MSLLPQSGLGLVCNTFAARAAPGKTVLLAVVKILGLSAACWTPAKRSAKLGKATPSTRSPAASGGSTIRWSVISSWNITGWRRLTT